MTSHGHENSHGHGNAACCAGFPQYPPGREPVRCYCAGTSGTVATKPENHCGECRAAGCAESRIENARRAIPTSGTLTVQFEDITRPGTVTLASATGIVGADTPWPAGTDNLGPGESDDYLRGYSDGWAARRDLPTACESPLHVWQIDVPAEGGERCFCGEEALTLPSVSIRPRTGERREGAIYAPFTPPQVRALNEWQRQQYVHPFTCGDDNCRADLVATVRGWICPFDDYTQTWAHAFMAEPFAPAPEPQRDRNLIARLRASVLASREDATAAADEIERMHYATRFTLHDGPVTLSDDPVSIEVRDGIGPNLTEVRRWVVARRGYVWSKFAQAFVDEPIPSYRTDEFIAETRFDSLDEAWSAALIAANGGRS